MGQDVSTTPAISIGDHNLDLVEKFTYLGYNISNNPSLDVELNLRIGRGGTAMARLVKRVWDNTMRPLNIKVIVYHARVLSTVIYGSKTWTVYSHQK